jgi:hypothetical protein
MRRKVERFSEEGRISDAVRFGATTLKYSLAMLSEAPSIHATFENEEIAVVVPETAARKWMTSDTVGLETEQAIGEGESLAILIEKDFACVERPDDPDRADAFPNPQRTCAQP